MFSCTGNIWDYQTAITPIVIPTNIGWDRNRYNVMGAGLAKQAAEEYRWLPKWYGGICSKYKDKTSVMMHPEIPLILFPVKPLNKIKPWLSWQYSANLELIEKSCTQLASIPRRVSRIYLPLVGCGNGGLEFEEVYPLLNKYLNNPDRFTLVVEEHNLSKLINWRANNPVHEKAIIKCGISRCDCTVEWGSREWAKGWCYHWMEDLHRSISLCPRHTEHALRARRIKDGEQT